MQRTPPQSAAMLSGSRSDSDLSIVGSNITNSEANITTRNKRQRMETSPNNSSSQSDFHSGDLRTDLFNMLNDWKEDQDRRLNEWKTSLDSALSRLVGEVTYLKRECQEIKKTNTEIEKGIEFMNKNQEEIAIKVKEIEKDKTANTDAIKILETQIQDIHFQTRQATIELRNIPVVENEKFDNLFSIVSKIGKAMEFDISLGDLRDIYRLPGRPTIARPIVAEFACVHTKNELISRVRGFNREKPVTEKLNTQTIGLPGAKQPIYVDEHLAPSQRKLMFETRQFAKKHNFSCWHSNGRILLRMDPNSKPIIIRTERCLSEIGKKI